MTWRALGEPEESFLAGDDAVYERTRYYGWGEPDAEGQCQHEVEITYYAVEYEDGRYGTCSITHSYTRTGPSWADDITNEEYDYDVAGYLFLNTLAEAEREVDRFAREDESWKMVWVPVERAAS